MVRGLPIADTHSRLGNLFSVYEWLMIAVTAIVFALVLFALVRYRRRSDAYPRGKDQRTVVESVYAVFLTLLLFSLAYTRLYFREVV